MEKAQVISRIIYHNWSIETRGLPIKNILQVSRKLDIATVNQSLSQKMIMELFALKLLIRMVRIGTAAHLLIQKIKISLVLTKMKYTNSIDPLGKKSSFNLEQILYQIWKKFQEECLKIWKFKNKMKITIFFKNLD